MFLFIRIEVCKFFECGGSGSYVVGLLCDGIVCSCVKECGSFLCFEREGVLGCIVRFKRGKGCLE